jgi:hypothetical protein
MADAARIANVQREKARQVEDLDERSDPTLDRTASFVRLVHPFLFAPRTFGERCKAVDDANWSGDRGKINVWENNPPELPEWHLLPHIARYVVPGGEAPSARFWRLGPSALESRAGLLSAASWSAVWHRGEERFRLERVELVLFAVGVGVLSLCTKPESKEPDRWHDFVHFTRYLRGGNAVKIRIDRHTKAGVDESFFPQPAGGAARLDPMGRGYLADVVAALVETATIDGDLPKWHEEGFVSGLLIPYSALYFDGVSAAEIPERVYRARSFFYAAQMLHPSAEDRRLDQNSALLPFGSLIWLATSVEGGTFLAFDAPRHDFWRRRLPDHLANEYFLLFLLALHQRLALMALSDEVAGRWPMLPQVSDAEKREQAFREIRDKLLAFTARSYFAQVMQREHHHRVYRRWLETFQIERLYAEVSAEIREMFEYSLLRRTERIAALQQEAADRDRARQEKVDLLERRLGQLAFILGPPGLVVGFLGATGGVHWMVALELTALGMLAGILSLIAVNRTGWRP